VGLGCWNKLREERQGEINKAVLTSGEIVEYQFRKRKVSNFGCFPSKPASSQGFFCFPFRSFSLEAC
jgi:hypothetical protein